MEIVECGMCYELHQLEDWEEDNIFICKKCADVLSRIRKMEIEKGCIFSDKIKLAIFDMLRGIL